MNQLQGITSPTFSGLNMKEIYTPSISYVVFGECDYRSEVLAVSRDQENWTPLEGGCSKNGKFTLKGSANPEDTVHVRAVAFQQVTAPAVAKIKFITPPSSDFILFVNSARTDSEGALGAQNAISLGLSGYEMHSSQIKLDTHLVEVVYE